ncbi:hypothetical protein ABZ508_33000 [Streptomyces lavendulocolor]|uniref:Uncharacterized protein n=1 Tax=Streptomyces lavendulocolor TaxID=67316 RepID=A0ABV2WFN8_9ACTN
MAVAVEGDRRGAGAGLEPAVDVGGGAQESGAGQVGDVGVPDLEVAGGGGAVQEAAVAAGLLERGAVGEALQGQAVVKRMALG